MNIKASRRSGLVVLLVGVAVGLMLSGLADQPVYANPRPVEWVEPDIVIPNAVFHTVLSHRAVVDSLTVDDIDVLRFQKNLVKLIARKLEISEAEIQDLWQRSMVEKFLRADLGAPPAVPGLDFPSPEPKH